VAGYIDAGEAAGATLVVDGRAGKFDADGNEFFIGPTLFDEVRTDMSSYSDEIFRPVLSVFRIDTYEEAVKLIYATPTATGPRSSPTTAARRGSFQNEIEVGMTGITVTIIYYSFGGWRKISPRHRVAAGRA
jgi:malonate-semialdehyde dehydrogenase (acetylating)/methylmalonate-semialdehyde dehydrogenase